MDRWRPETRRLVFHIDRDAQSKRRREGPEVHWCHLHERKDPRLRQHARRQAELEWRERHPLEPLGSARHRGVKPQWIRIRRHRRAMTSERGPLPKLGSVRAQSELEIRSREFEIPAWTR